VTARVTELRWLTWASVVETVSLAVLVANRATVHQPLVTSTMGPVHGFAYLVTIAIAFLLPLATGTRLLTLVPGVGGLLALRRARHGPVAGPADGGRDPR